MRLAKILVPLDGSALAETILSFVRGIATPLTEVVIFHVVPTAALDAVNVAREVGAEDPILKDLDAMKYLEPLAETLKADGIRASIRVRIGDPQKEIVLAAKQVKADMIAMTTHGGTGLGRVVLGSVAQEILRTSPIPVVLFGVNDTLASASTKRP